MDIWRTRHTLCPSTRAHAITQFTVASSVYYTASVLFPAKETYINAAVLPDDAIRDVAEMESEDMEKASVEKAIVQDEIKSAHSV